MQLASEKMDFGVMWASTKFLQFLDARLYFQKYNWSILDVRIPSTCFQNINSQKTSRYLTESTYDAAYWNKLTHNTCNSLNMCTWRPCLDRNSFTDCFSLSVLVAGMLLNWFPYLLTLLNQSSIKQAAYCIIYQIRIGQRRSVIRWTRY